MVKLPILSPVQTFMIFISEKKTTKLDFHMSYHCMYGRSVKLYFYSGYTVKKLLTFSNSQYLELRSGSQDLETFLA